MSFFKHVGIVAGATAHATESDRGGNTHPSQFVGEGVVFSLPEQIYGQSVAYAEITLFVTAKPGSEGEVVLGTLYSPLPQYPVDSTASVQVAFVRGRAIGDVVGLESAINDTVTIPVVVKPTDSITVRATKGSVHVGVMVRKIV